MTHHLKVAAVLASLLAPLPALGQEAPANATDPDGASEGTSTPHTYPVRYTLRYQGEAGCADPTVFDEALAQRLPSARSSASGTFLDLRVVRQGDEFRGTLGVGLRTSREIRSVVGASCKEVLEALSVVASVALDPRFEGSEPPSPPPPLTTPATHDQMETKSTQEEADHAPVEDEPIPPPTGNVAKKPKWVRPLHLDNQTRVESGMLGLRRTFTIDAAAGINVFLMTTPTSRIDITARTALLLTPPGQRTFAVGFLPRIRLNILPKSLSKEGDASNSLGGFGVFLGGCYTPRFDPTGFSFLACADYGAGVFYRNSYGDYTGEPVASSYEAINYSRVSLSGEIEQRIWRWASIGLRAGIERNLSGRITTMGEDGMYSGWGPMGLTLFSSATVGGHF